MCPKKVEDLLAQGARILNPKEKRPTNWQRAKLALIKAERRHDQRRAIQGEIQDGYVANYLYNAGVYQGPPRKEEEKGPLTPQRVLSREVRKIGYQPFEDYLRIVPKAKETSVEGYTEDDLKIP